MYTHGATSREFNFIGEIRFESTQLPARLMYSGRCSICIYVSIIIIYLKTEICFFPRRVTTDLHNPRAPGHNFYDVNKSEKM